MPYPTPLDRRVAQLLATMDRRIKLLEVAGAAPIAVNGVFATQSIQSPNFDPSTPAGWYLDASGNSHMHSVHIVHQPSNANQLTGDDANFQTSVGGWQGLSNANAPTQSVAPDNVTNAMAIVTQATGTPTVVANPTFYAIPVNAGDSVTVSAKWWGTSGGLTVQHAITFADDYGNSVSGGTTGLLGSSHAIANGSFTTVTDTYIVPVGATQLTGIQGTISGASAYQVTYSAAWTAVDNTTSIPEGLFVYSGTPALGNLIISIAAVAGTDAYGNVYPQGIFVAQGLIEGPDYIFNSSGLFVYSATPALGNLIAGIAALNGTDQFGNVYYKGHTAYAPSGGANANVIAQLVAAGLSVGPPAAFNGTGGASPGGLSGSTASGQIAITSGLASSSDTQAEIQLVSQSDSGSTNSPELLVSGVIAMIAQGAPASQGPYIWGYSTSAIGGKSFGFAGQIPISQTDITTYTVTQNTMTRISNSWAYPAADASTGTVYRLKAYGAGKTGTASSLLAFQLSGLAGSVAVINVGATFMANSTNFSWAGEWIISIRSAGASGTADVVGWLNLAVFSGTALTGTTQLEGSGNSVNAAGGFAGQNTTLTVNTIAANNFTLQAGWGTITGAPTISCYSNTLERLGP